MIYTKEEKQKLAGIFLTAWQQLHWHFKHSRDWNDTRKPEDWEPHPESESGKILSRLSALSTERAILKADDETIHRLHYDTQTWMDLTGANNSGMSSAAIMKEVLENK